MGSEAAYCKHTCFLEVLTAYLILAIFVFCIFLRQELGTEVKFAESQYCIFHHVNDSSETICTTTHTSTKLRAHNTHIHLRDSSTEDALEMMNESLYKDIYDIYALKPNVFVQYIPFVILTFPLMTGIFFILLCFAFKVEQRPVDFQGFESEL